MDQKSKKASSGFNAIVDSKSKSMKIAEQIMEAIRNGVFEAGDKLPSESDLAEEMGVSRPSVREALSGLQAIGAVETKKGSGTYVSDPNPGEDLGRSGVLILEEEANYLEIMEARESIETAALEIIINHVDVDDLEELKKILDRMKQHVNSREYEKYMDADHAFHQRLVESTSNSLVRKSMEPLVKSIDGRVYRELTHKYYLNDDSHIQRCYGVHESIYQSIKDKDLEGAEEGMHRHWTLMKEALEDSD